MKSGEVILILAGAFLCLSLTFVVFKLCQYLRNKKNKFKNVDKRTICCPNNSDIQPSLRTVETQLPVENQLSNNSSHCLCGKEKTPTVLVVNENYPRERSYSELSDSVFLDEPYNFKPRAMSQIELKQYKRSQEAMEHIRIKNMKVYNSANDCSRSVVPSKINSEVNLPNYDSDKVSTDSLFSDSDKSGSGSSSMGYKERNVEYLSSIRQKLASNRNSKQIQLRKIKIGTITMKAKFQNNTGSLEINIIQIINFNEKTRKSILNYMVCLSIMPGNMQTKTSKCVKNSNGLIFNEQFCFYNLDFTQLHLYSLKITLISCNKFKRKKSVAESLIHLTNLKHAGEKSNIYSDLFCRFKSKASMASLHISLCHQATISKLDVIIEEAKQLPKFSNTYVTVSLFREEEIEMKNTSTKYNTSDPLFNQSIEFDIGTDGSNPLSVFTLVVTVYDLNFLGKNRVIGHVIFSLHSPQKLAATHWNRVQNLPHQTHSEWHSLIDPSEI
ncbi:synaptotagmin-4-like [Hydra vulgaris]|uniref:Synaptotagmin-4-like n=1 Tax=Hydra vulgaris TaxID=6087 RepID=A0ABM4B577_HYDVU